MMVPMKDPFVKTMEDMLDMMAWDYALGMTVEDRLDMMTWDYALGMTVDYALVNTMMVAEAYTMGNPSVPEVAIVHASHNCTDIHIFYKAGTHNNVSLDDYPYTYDNW